MGTNYYTKEKKCKTCEHEPEGIHLGKSSAGWQFSFAYNSGKFYKNIEEMKEWLKTKKITNEYGDTVTHKEFWDMIESKQRKDMLNHVTECKGKYGKHYDDCLHLIDGYSFTDTEFS